MKCCFRLPRGQFVLAWAATMPNVNFLSSTSNFYFLPLEEHGWWPQGHRPCRLQFSGDTNRHNLKTSWAKMLQRHFLLRCLLWKTFHHFNFLLLDWKHWWSLHFSFSFVFHEAKEVMEVMEKRGYSWGCEKFRFTKYNRLNSSLADCMD